MDKADLERHLRELGTATQPDHSQLERLRNRLEQDIDRFEMENRHQVVRVRRRRPIRMQVGAAIVAGGAVAAFAAAAVIDRRHSMPPAPAESADHTAAGFDEKVDWSGQHTIPAGVQSVQTVAAPAQFETSVVPVSGTAEILVSNGATSIAAGATADRYDSYFTKQIVFRGPAVQVNGEMYTVPAADRGGKLLVLPIGQGIVWVPVDTAWQGAEALQYTDGKLKANPAALKGAQPIYYTPYQAHGGSLSEGAVTIGTLPHRWDGASQPAVLSAWTGWLQPTQIEQPDRGPAQPTGDLLVPKTADGSVLKSITAVNAFTGFPHAFDTTVSAAAKGTQPLIASVRAITRTAGGFVLTVDLRDPNHGGNTGVSEADYYWSASANRWVPLTQLYGVQTIVGTVDVGSSGVYWEEELPGPAANDLYVAQMHYDPITNQMRSVWLGNWLYGKSFVDGDTWVVQMGKSWSLYPPAR